MSEQDKDNNEQNTPKLVFAEGCFDDFEGTQEELDNMVDAIQEMFANKTIEEIKAMSIPVDEFEDIDDEVLELLPMLAAGNTRQ